MSEIRVDTISEKTSANGVAVDGVTLKDGAITSTAASTITVADNSDTLTLKSTDTDASAGPILKLSRDNNSASASDVVGKIIFTAEDGGNNLTDYAEFLTQITDASDGSESVRFIIKGMKGGNYRKLIDFNTTETIFNDESDDLDFRVESNGNTHALFVDAGNNRVGINNSSPSQALDVTGNLVISGISRFGNGSAASPAYQFGDDTNTGMFRATSDTLGFSTAGSERVRVDASGRLGIGTTDVSQNLESVVSNTTSIPTDASMGSTNTDTASGIGIHNENNSAVYSGINLETRTTHASRWLMGNEWKSSYNGDLFFRARDGASSSSEILRLKSDGNVGISESSPDTLLHITQGGEPPAEGILILEANSASRQLRIQPPTDADNGFIDFRGGNLTFQDDGTEIARFQGSTGFGIGVTNVTNKLDIASDSSNHIRLRSATTEAKGLSLAFDNGNDRSEIRSDQQGVNQKDLMVYALNHNFGRSAADINFKIDDSGNVIVKGTNADLTFASSGNNINFARNSDNYVSAQGGTSSNLILHGQQRLVLQTASTERMRIDSSGSFFVGKTSSGYGDIGHEFHSAGLAVHTRNENPVLLLNRNTSEGTIQLFRYNNSDVGSISVTSSSTAFNTSSDYRLKENVSYDFDATSRLKQLKPSRFNFIADADKTVDGFLAHEVSDIVPEAISGEKDAVDSDGNPEYQAIDQSKLVPLLVKTIQELEARITTLENN